LTLLGITTDGSPLYPTPLAEVLSGVPHQLCQFHVVKDIVKAVVKAVSSERKRLAAQQPQLPWGRPRTKAAKQAARTKKRLAAQRAALFTSRYLFVQRHLNKTERKTLWRVSRGLPQLHALRAVMDHVYALFDRRCRTQTALDKLAKLRRRLQRFPQLGETLEFIPLSFWYDAPLTSRYSDRRPDPWLVYGSPTCSPARWSSWISPA
jgi:hypothetical protein